MKGKKITTGEKSGMPTSLRSIILSFCILCVTLQLHAQLSYVTLPPLTTNNYDYGDIIVPGGNSLTITASNARFGTITVRPEAQLIIKNTTILMRNKIVVQCGPECSYSALVAESDVNKPTYYCQGGELLVQGSTITSVGTLAYRKWNGIEVWGPDNIQAVQTQTKGHVFLTSSAIANAKVGILTCRSNFTKKGGLIRATDTKFLNNDFSIQYYGTPSAPTTIYIPPFYMTELAVNGLQYFFALHV